MDWALDYFEKLYKTLSLEQWRFYNLSSPLEFSLPKFHQVADINLPANLGVGCDQPPPLLLIGGRVKHLLFHRTVYLLDLCSWVSIWFTKPLSVWKMRFLKYETIALIVIALHAGSHWPTEAFSGRLPVRLRQDGSGQFVSFLWIPSFSCKKIHWSRANSAEKE